MTRAAREHDPAGVLDARLGAASSPPSSAASPSSAAYLLGELLRGGMVEARMLESRAEASRAGEVLFTGRLLLGRTAGGVDLGQRAVQATFVDEQGTWRVVRAHVEPVR